MLGSGSDLHNHPQMLVESSCGFAISKLEYLEPTCLLLGLIFRSATIALHPDARQFTCTHIHILSCSLTQVPECKQYSLLDCLSDSSTLPQQGVSYCDTRVLQGMLAAK